MREASSWGEGSLPPPPERENRHWQKDSASEKETWTTGEDQSEMPFPEAVGSRHQAWRTEESGEDGKRRPGGVCEVGRGGEEEQAWGR